jgi:acetolactate synthase-1/2/3 large subunit
MRGLNLFLATQAAQHYTSTIQFLNKKHVSIFWFRHEQGATHAADGYSRATGKPGVALVTSGPGATNAITGLATAYMDSIPLVVISGQVQSHLIGTDSFQETDMIGISRPIVKHSFHCPKYLKIFPRIVQEAFHIATTGRPGPVVIDIPKDKTDPSQLYEYKRAKEISLTILSTKGAPSSRSNQKSLQEDIVCRTSSNLCRRWSHFRKCSQGAHFS